MVVMFKSLIVLQNEIHFSPSVLNLALLGVKGGLNVAM